MESLSTPSSLYLLWDLKRALEKNQSLQVGVKFFIYRGFNCRFSKSFHEWWLSKQMNNSEASSAKPSPDTLLNTPLNKSLNSKFNIRQQALIQILEKGLEGAPIYENLKSLEKDFLIFCEDDIQSHTALLPLLMQIPLMGLIMPAILALLIIPALGLLQI